MPGPEDCYKVEEVGFNLSRIGKKYYGLSCQENKVQLVENRNKGFVKGSQVNYFQTICIFRYTYI